MATRGTKLSDCAKTLISSFFSSSLDHKAVSRKSRKGFKLMISFQKGLVIWGILWRSHQEGTLKLPILLKSPHTANESACLLKSS